MRLQQFVAVAWIAIVLAASGALIGFSAESLIQSQATARAIFMAGRRTAHEWPLCRENWEPVKSSSYILIDTNEYVM